MVAGQEWPVGPWQGCKWSNWKVARLLWDLMPDPLGRKEMWGIMWGLMANKAGCFKVTNSLFKQFHLFLAVRIINTLMALRRGCTRFHFTVSVRSWNYTPTHTNTHTPELAKIWNTVNTCVCSPSWVTQCCCELWLSQTQTVYLDFKVWIQPKILVIRSNVVTTRCVCPRIIRLLPVSAKEELGKDAHTSTHSLTHRHKNMHTCTRTQTHIFGVHTLWSCALNLPCHVSMMAEENPDVDEQQISCHLAVG